MVKLNSKTGIVLVILYVLAGLSIWLTSYRCDWSSGTGNCSTGLQTASYPASMITSLAVYPILKMAGHLDSAIKTGLIWYDIFYPSFVLNILIYYGLGILINEFMFASKPNKDGKEYRYLLGDKELENQKIFKLLIIIGVCALTFVILGVVLK
jgi:hypothetical protein